MKKALLISTGFICIIFTFAWLDLHSNLNLDSLSQLYGLDYLTIFLILTGQSLLRKKNKTAFYFYIAGNIVNIGLGYLVKSPIIMAFSFVGIYIMYKNFIQWKKDDLLKK